MVDERTRQLIVDDQLAAPGGDFEIRMPEVAVDLVRK
jgi:hypothetical protein